MRTFICKICNKQFQRPRKQVSYCSLQCYGKSGISWNRGKHGVQDYSIQSQKAREQMLREYSSGIRDPHKITEKAHEKVREMGKLGTLWIQKLENRIDKAKKRQEKRALFPETISKWERIMAAHLAAHAPNNLIEEFAFREFNIDFAYPNEKIAIEINIGWHNSPTHIERDKAKAVLLRDAGWKLYINRCPFCGWILKFR